MLVGLNVLITAIVVPIVGLIAFQIQRWFRSENYYLTQLEKYNGLKKDLLPDSKIINLMKKSYENKFYENRLKLLQRTIANKFYLREHKKMLLSEKDFSDNKYSLLDRQFSMPTTFMTSQYRNVINSIPIIFLCIWFMVFSIFYPAIHLKTVNYYISIVLIVLFAVFLLLKYFFPAQREKKIFTHLFAAHGLNNDLKLLLLELKYFKTISDFQNDFVECGDNCIIKIIKNSKNNDNLFKNKVLVDYRKRYLFLIFSLYILVIIAPIINNLS